MEIMPEHNSIHLEKQKEIEQKEIEQKIETERGMQHKLEKEKEREKEKEITQNYFDNLNQILILHIFN